MASVMVVNSKSALVFAGGVILAAALFASVFTPIEPKAPDAPEQAETPRPAPKRAASTQSAASDPVFQDYTGPGGDDGSLIDDTAGFDTTPILDDADFGEDGNYDTGNPSQYSDPDPGQTTRARSSARRASPARSNPQGENPPGDTGANRRRSPAKGGMTIEEMKERLAQPPRVSETDTEN